MTAGAGIAHSEEATGRYAGELQGIQLWVAQPEETRHGAPAFEHHAELPRLELGAGTATVLVGALQGASLAGAARHRPPRRRPRAPGRHGGAAPRARRTSTRVVVLEGRVAVDGRSVEPGVLAYLGVGHDELAARDRRTPARAMLLGGTPFEDELVMWWNYVARTRDEVAEAHRAWTAQDTDRFGEVPSPLPAHRHRSAAVGALRWVTSTPCARSWPTSGRWWWRSPAGPTRPSSPGSPTTCSARSGPLPSPPCRRRWPAPSTTTAGALAAEWGLTWREVQTEEMANAAYQRNDLDRCFWCKDALMDAVGPIVHGADATVALGVNLDDLDDHRPGQEAARQRGAVFPLVEAGFTKDDVRRTVTRARAAHLGQAGCTVPRVAPALRRPGDARAAALGRAGRGRAAAMGFAELRVRHHEELARIEVPVDRLADVVAAREAVLDAVRAAGYRWVALDLAGLRSGGLNP